MSQKATFWKQLDLAAEIDGQVPGIDHRRDAMLLLGTQPIGNHELLRTAHT